VSLLYETKYDLLALIKMGANSNVALGIGGF
jgi:hypothetical protein